MKWENKNSIFRISSVSMSQCQGGMAWEAVGLNKS